MQGYLTICPVLILLHVNSSPKINKRMSVVTYSALKLTHQTKSSYEWLLLHVPPSAALNAETLLDDKWCHQLERSLRNKLFSWSRIIDCRILSQFQISTNGIINKLTGKVLQRKIVSCIAFSLSLLFFFLFLSFSFLFFSFLFFFFVKCLY